MQIRIEHLNKLNNHFLLHVDGLSLLFSKIGFKISAQKCGLFYLLILITIAWRLKTKIPAGTVIESCKNWPVNGDHPDVLVIRNPFLR